jgi:hypothetical protein
MIPDKFNDNKEKLLPITITIIIAANKTRTASGGGT